MDYGNPEKTTAPEDPTKVKKPTMDYAKSAEQIRNGPGDLPLVTLILAELLESLAPETTPETAEDVTLDTTHPVYPSSDEHPENLTLPKSDA